MRGSQLKQSGSVYIGGVPGVFGTEGISNPPPSYTVQLISDTHVGAISQYKLDAVLADKVIDPLCVVHTGDITQDGTVGQDADAIDFLDDLHDTWYVVNGGHDVLINTPAQFAVVYGMAGQNWVVETDVCYFIGLGMDDSSTTTLSSTQLTYLETQLAANTDKPCLMMCHIPPFYSVRNTDLVHYYSSDQANWFLSPDVLLRTVLSEYSNASAWLAGHLHVPYTSIDFVKDEIIGDHHMALVAASTPYYFDKVLGEQVDDPIITQYLTILPNEIQVRTRDHRLKQWLLYYQISLITNVDVESPIFSMQFSDAQAAPLDEYIDCDEGVLWTYNANALVAISGGELVANGANPAHFYAWTVPVVYRKCGRATSIDQTVRTNPNSCSFRMMEGSNVYIGAQAQGTTQVRPNTLTGGVMCTDSIGSDSEWSWMLVMRETGGFVMIRESGDPVGEWQIVCVRNDGDTALIPRLHLPSGAINTNFDNFEVNDLEGGFETQYGIATDYSLTTSNGETMVATTEGFFEHTITAQTGVTQEFMFRRQDDDNTWIVRMDQAGSSIELFSKEAAVETSRGSAAYTWTNGSQYRVVVSLRGNYIQVMVNDTYRKIAVSSSIMAANTGLKVSHAGEELVAWPATVTIA